MRAAAAALLRRGLACRAAGGLGGGRGASAEGDVADALAHLALLVVDAGASAAAFSRVAAAERGLGPKRVNAIVDAAAAARVAPMVLATRIAAGTASSRVGVPATGEARDALRSLTATHAALKARLDGGAGAADLLDEWSARRGGGDDGDAARCRALSDLQESAARHDASGSGADRAASVRAFVASLPLGASLLDDGAGGGGEAGGGGVTLTTVHQAKGLEWAPLTPALEDGIFPHARARARGGERRRRAGLPPRRATAALRWRDAR